MSTLGIMVVACIIGMLTGAAIQLGRLWKWTSPKPKPPNEWFSPLQPVKPVTLKPPNLGSSAVIPKTYGTLEWRGVERIWIDGKEIPRGQWSVSKVSAAPAHIRASIEAAKEAAKDTRILELKPKRAVEL